MSWWRWIFGRGRVASPVPEATDANAESGLLREFVYLDEVSVISLLASLQGEIKSGVTEALSLGSASEMTGEVGASSPVVTAKVGTKLTSTQSRSLQIVRQSVVQSQFKELYDRERGELLLDLTDDDPTEIAKSLPDEISVADLVEAGLALLCDDGRRGALIELDVQLDVDEFFALSAGVSSVSDLVKDHLDQFGLDRATFGSVSAISDVLQQLLVGLVPLRARALDYAVIADRHDKALIERSTLDLLGDRITANVSDLFIVGVSDRDLYWKDLREILFSGSRYTVMGRVKTGQLGEHWNGVKLLEVMDGAVKGVRSEIEDSLTKLRAEDHASTVASSTGEAQRAALEAFAQLLADAHGINDPAEVLSSAGLPSSADMDTSVDEPAQWEAFDRIATALTGVAADELDREEILRLRTQALQESLVSANGVIPDADAPSPRRSIPQLLECEVVAIYW